MALAIAAAIPAIAKFLTANLRRHLAQIAPPNVATQTAISAYVIGIVSNVIGHFGLGFAA
jgi:hypothetical protein